MTRTIRSEGQLALRDALVAQRLRAGLSQAQLAARLRCHQSLVARVESGERRIDVVELVVICRALNISPNIVLDAVTEHVTADQGL